MKLELGAYEIALIGVGDTITGAIVWALISRKPTIQLIQPTQDVTGDS